MSKNAPPWLTALKQGEITLLEFWRNNGSFQEKYMREFIKDALFLEISGICSSMLTVRSQDTGEGFPILCTVLRCSCFRRWEPRTSRRPNACPTWTITSSRTRCALDCGDRLSVVVMLQGWRLIVLTASGANRANAHFFQRTSVSVVIKW